MVRKSQELLDTRRIEDIAIAMDGRKGVLVYRSERPHKVAAGFQIPIVARLNPSGPETPLLRLAMRSDWPRELTGPLYRWKINVTEALPLFSTIAVGLYLDGAATPGSASELPHITLTDVLRELSTRREATYEEILSYLKAKVFWSWQFHYPVGTITKADLLRLGTEMQDMNEVASQRAGELWSITEEGTLRPTGQLIDLVGRSVRTEDSLVERRILAAILFADIVDSTRIMSDREDFALQLVEIFEASAREHVSVEHGTLVKFTGDGMISRFSNVPAAVRCGLNLLADFTGTSLALGHRGELRVGVHVGEIVCSKDGDIHGDVVHTAARVQSAAPPGSLVLTDEAWNQLRRSPGFRAQDLGKHELKNIEVPVRLYAVNRG